MATKYNLHSIRKQLSGKGTIWDYNIKGHPRISRVKIAKRRGQTNVANVYYDSSSKIGFRYKGRIDILKKKINAQFRRKKKW